MQKIKNIEFLRFIFAIFIICFHLFRLKFPIVHLAKDVSLYQTFIETFKNADMAVDFFFIISGFLLVMTFKNQTTFWDFFKKRFIRLAPVVWFSLFMYYIVLSHFGIVEYRYYENVFALLLINNIGLTLDYSDGPIWFVSALFWCSMFYFYIIKNFEKKYVNLVIPLITLFCYCFLINFNNGNLSYIANQVEYNVLNLGLMRGLAGMGLGYIIANCYKASCRENENKKSNLSLFARLGFTVCECCLLGFLISNMAFHKFNYNNNFIFILVFVGLFWLFLIRRGFISQLLDCDFNVFLGKYAYSIYCMHYIPLYLLTHFVWKTHTNFVIAYPVLNIFIPITASIVLGIITYYLIEKPMVSYLTSKWLPKNL